MEQSLTSLAQKVGGVVTGEGSTVITGVAAIGDAREGDITFVDSDQLLPLLHRTKASAALVSHEMPGVALPLLIVANPRVALAKILALFVQKPYVSQGISEKAWVSASATLGKDVTIYPYAYIGNEVRIGSRVTIYPGVYVGPEAEIGDDTIIYPNVSIYSRCLIGKRVILHAGAVIGADGFGFVRDGELHVKIPQVGVVEIGDDVEIGANSCVDRATLGKTVIERGVKVDNLVQVAHNVSIGEHSVIVAQVGISGSAKLGRNVTLAGQVGLTDHIEIGDNVMVGAQSGVMRDIPPNEKIMGSPSLPYKRSLRVTAVLQRLPELKKELEQLQRRVAALEKHTKGKQSR